MTSITAAAIATPAAATERHGARLPALLGGLLSLALAACSGDPAGGAQETTHAVAVSGEAVYRQHCAACHGLQLEGQPDWRRRGANGRLPAPPHDASGHTWHHADELLFNIVRDGMVPPWAPAGYASDMPAFRGVLSDADIRAVLAYIAGTWPDEVRTQRARLLAQQSRP